MDTIEISGIEAMAIIGTLPHERTERQRVVVDVTLGLDLSAAGASDRLEDSVDYSAMERGVVEVVEGSEYRLLEALCTAVGRVAMADARVGFSRVRIFKPAGSARGAGVAVAMEFRR